MKDHLAPKGRELCVVRPTSGERTHFKCEVLQFEQQRDRVNMLWLGRQKWGPC